MVLVLILVLFLVLVLFLLLFFVPIWSCSHSTVFSWSHHVKTMHNKLWECVFLDIVNIMWIDIFYIFSTSNDLPCLNCRLIEMGEMACYQERCPQCGKVPPGR
jgi:hypothetical protein